MHDPQFWHSTDIIVNTMSCVCLNNHEDPDFVQFWGEDLSINFLDMYAKFVQ